MFIQSTFSPVKFTSAKLNPLFIFHITVTVLNLVTLIVIMVTAIRVIKGIRSSTLSAGVPLYRRQENKLMWLTYSYFEKGCRKKCTRQSRKVLWVVKRMVQEAMDICLRVLKKSYKSSFDSYTSGTVYRLYPILPFGIVACTVFPPTFLEIAV